MRNKKEYEKLVSEVESLKGRIFLIEQKVCNHKHCKIVHSTSGHWRSDEYVGGNIYSLYCNDCHLKLDEVSNRWDTKWDESEESKFKNWLKRYGAPS